MTNASWKRSQQHGYQVLMTAAITPRAPIASRRSQRSAVGATSTIVVNVQGDEPRIAPGLIREVAEVLDRHAEASMSTACHALHRQEDLFDPNVVKVVLDARGDALYFSRATIPWARDAFAQGSDPHPVRPPGLPAHRHLRLSLWVSQATRRWSRRTSSASRPWSNCGPCGTGFESPSRSPSRRRKPESTPRRIWRPCAACSLPTREPIITSCWPTAESQGSALDAIQSPNTTKRQAPKCD